MYFRSWENRRTKIIFDQKISSISPYKSWVIKTNNGFNPCPKTGKKIIPEAYDPKKLEKSG